MWWISISRCNNGTKWKVWVECTNRISAWVGNVERRLFTHVIFELQSYYADMCIRHQFKLLCYMELSVGQQGNRGSSVKYMCEVHMLRWMCGVTRKGIIKSKYVRENLGVIPVKKRINKFHLRWFEHVQRRQKAILWVMSWRVLMT